MHLTYIHTHIYIHRLIYYIIPSRSQNYNGIQPPIGFHVNKHMWQTSTFMWQTMANPRINLSFGDAWYSDMYHPFMMILGRIFRSIHQATRFTGTFRVKNCEGVVIFGSPRTIFGSGSKSCLRRTVSQNVKISYFLKSILPKSERIKRVLFSGYGKFPKSGSKFQSVTINVFYVYIYI